MRRGFRIFIPVFFLVAMNILNTQSDDVITLKSVRCVGTERLKCKNALNVSKHICFDFNTSRKIIHLGQLNIAIDIYNPFVLSYA